MYHIHIGTTADNVTETMIPGDQDNQQGAQREILTAHDKCTASKSCYVERSSGFLKMLGVEGLALSRSNLGLGQGYDWAPISHALGTKGPVASASSKSKF